MMLGSVITRLTKYNNSVSVITHNDDTAMRLIHQKRKLSPRYILLGISSHTGRHAKRPRSRLWFDFRKTLT